MNPKKNNTLSTLENFWNEAFASLETGLIEEKDLEIDGSLETELKFLATKASTILDFGCGDGILDLKIGFQKTSCSLLGLDPSQNGITFAKKMAQINHLNNLKFEVGDLATLKTFKDQSFSAIIVSNVLDVVPSSLAVDMLHEFKRLLRDGGYLLIKINFYLEESMLQKNPRFVLKNKNEIYIDNVLRMVNQTSEVWKEEFKDFHLLKEETFARLKDGPFDRLFLLQK
jgi:ubiquinone/menaquinone biosynthesis C-methylase UbiE